MKSYAKRRSTISPTTLDITVQQNDYSNGLNTGPYTIEQLRHDVQNLEFKLEEHINKLEGWMDRNDGRGRETLHSNIKISEMQ